MNKIGPPLQSLTRRLTEIPYEFLDEPRIGRNGQVFVSAVVNDLLARISRRASLVDLRRFEGESVSKDRNRLMLVMVISWLLADEWFTEEAIPQSAIISLLDGIARELAGSSHALKYVEDPDRREELARIVLARLDCRPAGETLAQATDRLSALSITERRRLLKATQEAEARARAIREELIKKQAEASADKWTRE